MRSFQFILIFIVFSASILFSSCEKEDDPIPTKTRMEGVWKVVEAYDSAGTSILNKVQFPIAAFHLSSDNTVISTGGPLTTYVVYGNNKWTEVSSKFDQVFNYASLSFNGGEFFVGDGVVERFTLEMKLEGIGGTKTLSEILSIFGIQQQWLKEVVYHKFRDIKVSFNETNELMTWTFDNYTSAVYNMKDNYGDYVLWGGWPVNKFSRCTFVLQKQTKSLRDIVQEATTSK